MGMNTGMVVVGKIGDNLRMDYTAVGDTTNLAARLQSLAQPGLIYTSPSIYAAGHSYFDFKPLGKHTLKGISESVAVYELLGRVHGKRTNPAPGPWAWLTAGGPRCRACSAPGGSWTG